MSILVTATYQGRIDERRIWTPRREIVLGLGTKCVVVEVLIDGQKGFVKAWHKPHEPVPVVTVQDLNQPWVPKVGDGCSNGGNGDSYPNTVRKVSKSRKTIWISRDDYQVHPGCGEPYAEGSKDCWFFPLDTPEETWSCYKLKSDGRYRSAGKVYRGQPGLSQGRSYSQNPHI